MYEGLFLVDSAIAAADWQLVHDAIQKILAKAGADVVSFRKWDERKLTYDIGRVSRGTYILVYFNCDTLRVHEVERDVQLSETLMRVMILRTDEMPQADIEKPTPLMIAETQAADDAKAAHAIADDVAEAIAADIANDDVEEQV
jgi:ribosomal protein S6